MRIIEPVAHRLLHALECADAVGQGGKFGGLFDRLLGRYGAASRHLRPALEAFSPTALRTWCEGLGQTTFVGSSGRVFPKAFKTSPLLRAWLRRLDDAGVTFKLRHHWVGWDAPGNALFDGLSFEARHRVEQVAWIIQREDQQTAWRQHTPDFAERDEPTPDLAPAHERAVVSDRDVGQADPLFVDRELARVGQIQAGP
jgi:hypothetical protein